MQLSGKSQVAGKVQRKDHAARPSTQTGPPAADLMRQRAEAGSARERVTHTQNRWRETTPRALDDQKEMAPRASQCAAPGAPPGGLGGILERPSVALGPALAWVSEERAGSSTRTV